jgi:hypothetical protein
MYIQKFSNNRYPKLFIDKPIEGNEQSSLDITDSRFSGLKESDGPIEVSLIASRPRDLSYPVFSASVGNDYDLNDHLVEIAKSVANDMINRWTEDAELSTFCPNVKVKFEEPDLSIDDNGTFQIFFTTDGTYLHELIHACMVFSSEYTRRIK